MRKPTPAERYAQPCGHRLPADFNGDTDNEGDENEEIAAWQERLGELAGDGGGCLETAQVAATEREESRRGVVKGLSALLATFGLGAGATGTAGANPAAPGTLSVANTYVCTGEVDVECVAAAATGSGGCYPCAAKPSHMTCVPCAMALVGAGIISCHECCVGGKW